MERGRPLAKMSSDAHTGAAAAATVRRDINDGEKGGLEDECVNYWAGVRDGGATTTGAVARDGGGEVLDPPFLHKLINIMT